MDSQRSTLLPADLLRTATVGLRARKLRGLLSGLAVAVGIAAVVSVLGITRSSESALLAEIDQTGTNMLTVTNGQDLSGQEVELPQQATGMIGRTQGVQQVAPTAEVPAYSIYRTDKVPRYASNGLGVRACDQRLLAATRGTLRRGTFLTPATARYPVAVLGYQAAVALGVTKPGTRIWVARPGGSITGTWLTVTGILNPVPLAQEIDSSVLVGFPAAGRLFGYDGHPSRIYVSSVTDETEQTAALLAPAAWPDHPDQVQVSRPSDALTARIAVRNSGTTLFVGLGAIAILAGGLGIANVMVISVLERRPEIGLRRSLGARRGHVGLQFLTEAVLLSAVGGVTGAVIGSAVTFGVAASRHWAAAIPASAVGGGLAVAVGAGALAGCYPALRAARLSPADALRST